MIATLTMNPSIDLLCESDVVDLAGHKTRCSAALPRPGGGGINVAREVRALGGEVIAIHACGGPGGEQLVELLDAEGLPQRPVRISGSTRRNIALSARNGEQRLHLVFPGPTLGRDEYQACAGALLELDPLPDYVVLSGSLAPGVPHDFYADLARRCTERGSRVIVDTSGPALESVLQAGVFLVKPNRHEFERLFGLDPGNCDSCIAEMEALIARGGARAIVVTLGGEGALLVGEGYRVQLCPPPVEAGNAVAAGDTLVAALVHRLDLDGGLLEGLASGVAAAAAVVSSGDAEVRDADSRRALREQVEMKELPPPVAAGQGKTRGARR